MENPEAVFDCAEDIAPGNTLPSIKKCIAECPVRYIVQKLTKGDCTPSMKAEKENAVQGTS